MEGESGISHIEYIFQNSHKAFYARAAISRIAAPSSPSAGLRAAKHSDNPVYTRRHLFRTVQWLDRSHSIVVLSVVLIEFGIRQQTSYLSVDDQMPFLISACMHQ